MSISSSVFLIILALAISSSFNATFYHKSPYQCHSYQQVFNTMAMNLMCKNVKPTTTTTEKHQCVALATVVGVWQKISRCPLKRLHPIRLRLDLIGANWVNYKLIFRHKCVWNNQKYLKNRLKADSTFLRLIASYSVVFSALNLSLACERGGTMWNWLISNMFYYLWRARLAAYLVWWPLRRCLLVCFPMCLCAPICIWMENIDDVRFVRKHL